MNDRSFSLVHREAGQILSRRGNRLLLIEAWMVLLVMLPLYSLVGSVIWAIPQEWIGNESAALVRWAFYGCFLLAFSLFATLPLFVGLLGMAERMERDEETVLADLFLPFSSRRRYVRALRISFGILWRGILAILPAIVTVTVVTRFANGNTLAALICAALVLAEIALGVVLWLRHFFAPYADISNMDGIPPRHPQDASALRQTAWREGARFWFGYLPHIVLGVLTVGIYLFAETLPRMCVAYFRRCRYINESLILSEEEKI